VINFPPKSFPPTPVYVPRKALQDTAYRLNYVEHVVQCEFDEVESALTEEDKGHQNIEVLALILQHLATAQEALKAAINILEQK
jgi:hypothetical protein